MCHPLLLSHLTRTTSTSSSSFTPPSFTTPEHALQSGQHDLLQEHPEHNQPLRDLPVDKRRHQEQLWRENLQSGGNPRKTFSTQIEDYWNGMKKKNCQMHGQDSQDVFY